MTPISTLEKLFIVLKITLYSLFVDLPLDIYDLLTKPRKKEVKGQVAVVTGGGRGIGRDLALKLALKHQAIVVLLDTDYESCSEVVKQIEREGGEAFAFEADVTDREKLGEVAGKIYKHPKLGRVDLLICNAELKATSELMEATDETVRRIVDVNLLGTIWTIRAFLARMMEKNSGHVIAISSIAGIIASPKLAVYSASKFGLQGLMDSLRWELADSDKLGVKISTLYLGFPQKRMKTEQQFDQEMIELEEATEKILDAILKERANLCIPNPTTCLRTILKWILPPRTIEIASKYYRDYSND